MPTETESPKPKTIKIKTIKVGYSENSRLDSISKRRPHLGWREIMLELEFEDFHYHQSEKLGYEKTDVVVIWEDGESYSLRYDIGDGVSLAKRLDHTEYVHIMLKGKVPYERFYIDAVKFMENRELPQ